MNTIEILEGHVLDRLRELPDNSIHCCVTSPPYWGLRTYHTEPQVWGGEKDCKHKWDGQTKNLCLIPQRLAIALQEAGWWVRSTFPWLKRAAMPESTKDRFTTAHEWILMLTKSSTYFFDMDAVRVTHTDVRGHQRLKSALNQTASTREGKQMFTRHREYHPQGRHRRTTDAFFEGLLTDVDGTPNAICVKGRGFSGAHFATFPETLVEPLIKCGCPKGGVVLDPFGGSGTTALVADRLGRDAILIELNPEYAAMARERVFEDAPLFHQKG